MFYLFTFYVFMKPFIDRLVIAQLAASGENKSTNASRLKVSFWTVQRIIVKQWKEVGNVDIKKKSSRPPYDNTPKIRNIIKKRSILNDGKSLNSIAKRLDISHGSVQNFVENPLGLHS